MNTRIHHNPDRGSSYNVPEPGLAAGLDKEAGSVFLRDEQIAGDAPDFVAALSSAGLPVDDLAEMGRTFYAYRTHSDRLIGYSGFERYGRDVLLRSIFVPLAYRNRGMGRSLLTLLLQRAHSQGARQAWLLTETATPFFERAGFETVAREHAPPTILATRQAQSLCPVSASLMTRSITF